MGHNYKHTLAKNRASLVAQMVKNSPANVGDTEMWVGSLGQDGPLEKEMANLLQSSYLENSIDRGAWWAIQSMGSQESDTT